MKPRGGKKKKSLQLHAQTWFKKTEKQEFYGTPALGKNPNPVADIFILIFILIYSHLIVFSVTLNLLIRGHSSHEPPKSPLVQQFPPAWGWNEELGAGISPEKVGARTEKNKWKCLCSWHIKEQRVVVWISLKTFPGTQLKCLGCFLSGSLHFVVGNKGKPNC